MDVFSFVRQEKSLSGAVKFAELARFALDLPAQGEASLVWSAQGEVGRRGELWLHLAFSGAPQLRCQRCLEAFAWPVDARVRLQIVASESELDELGGWGGSFSGTFSQAELLDDTPEKILGATSFDLLAQIEDELILTVPAIPRHEVCPVPGFLGAAPTCEAEDASSPPARPSPFAALAALKH